MFLTKEEERLLESPNEGVRKCMEILVAVGEIFGAEKLIEIKSAQISGVSYSNIGEAGLEWLESLDVRVSVDTYLNPAGFDLERWREMGISEDYYEKQMRVVRAFERMGVKITLSCTPYYIGEVKRGDHLAWAESSAVVYANSVVGARTNRESGITALASAVIGKTPYYGLHVKENRAPTIFVEVRTEKFALAGLELGRMLKEGEIPIVKFERKPCEEELKLFGAALASTSSCSLFHAFEITPEWKDFEIPKEKITIEEGDLDSCQPDLIAIGCPHASKRELQKIYDLLKKFGRAKKELWIFTSRKVREESREIVEGIEKLGGKVFTDTCMVVSPSTEKFECVMVNSGKALEYLPKLRKVKATFGSLEECVRRAALEN